MKPKFEVEFLPESDEFLSSLQEKVKKKILFNISKSRFINDNELFKKLNDFIWEFRTIYNGNSYRLFAFWSEEETTMVIATHGIMKKSQKTPPKEILKAEKIRQSYLEYKTKKT